MTTWILAEINRDAKKRPAPYKPADFMPYAPKPDEKEKAGDLSARLRAALMAMPKKPKAKK